MVLLNGKLLPETQAHMTMANRGLLYGDAVFETLRFQDNKILFWEDHYFRLMSSMRIMRMEIPMDFTMEVLGDQIDSVIKSHDASNSYAVKLFVYRNANGKYTPDSNDVGYFIKATPLNNAFYLIDDQPYTVELFKDHYVMGDLLSTIKSNNKAINVLGSIFAKENGYDNCLLLNHDKQVIEALNANLFLVKGTVIKTPPLTSGCLNGILRNQLIKMIGKLPDYTLEEAPISPFELQKADELFITNTLIGIKSIRQYRKKEYETKVARNLLGKLNAQIRLS
ncbi:MAG: aminotransferase class IV [Gilvibacter sp.]